MDEIARNIINIGSRRVSFVERGEGMPLVLLHGIGSTATSWAPQLLDLADSFRVIAWDAPGYGQSSPVRPKRPSPKDYVSVLHDFLNALSIECLHLVGHSLGSIMAARYAAENSERIESLTLASIAHGHLTLPSTRRDQLLAARLDDLERLGPFEFARARGPRLLSSTSDAGILSSIIDTMASISPDAYRQAAFLLSRSNTMDDIRRLPRSLRLQIIFGSEDRITTSEENWLALSDRPTAPLHLIENAGHAVYVEKPQQFNDLIRAHAKQ